MLFVPNEGRRTAIRNQKNEGRLSVKHIPLSELCRFRYVYVFGNEPDSVIGVASGYGLDGLGIKSRWGRDFPHMFQTGPGAHTASCTMGTGSFPGIKSGRGVTLTPHPLLVPLVINP